VGSLGKFSEYQNPFGMFLGCAEAWGTAWKKARRGLVIFENPFRIFIDQKIGGSISDWIF
jgi:hypothetical protein